MTTILNNSYLVKVSTQGERGQNCPKFCPRGLYTAPKHYENEIAQRMVTQSIDENNQVKIFPNVIPTKAQTSIVTIILSTVVTVFILMLTFMFIFWKWKKGRALQNMPTHEEIYLSEFYLDR